MNKQKPLECILLIDDDKPTNFLHEHVIEESGLDVHVQSVLSAQAGLDYLASEGEFVGQVDFPRPGIIFLDINMPGMNGWDFLDKYHELSEEKQAGIVVAMLTTSLNPDDEEKAREYPQIKGFTNKPLTVEDLLEMVRSNFLTEL